MTTNSKRGEFTLGLDLGARSLGWQLLRLENGEPVGIAACGVHTFDAGVEGDIEGGRDESRAAARRQARLTRRNFWRRQRRRVKLLRILKEAKLLPPGDTSTPEGIHAYFLKLDADLRSRVDFGDCDARLLPYRLRAAALDRPLDASELGRALYHLGQRRGFKSNRRSQPKKDEEPGQIKAEIGDLYERMRAAGARTLGEYFASLNPEKDRVRRWHTHRDMFTQEFDAIWNAQQPHHPSLLAPELRKQLLAAMFYQRPLKDQSNLIGECELMPGKKRCAAGLPVAQEFRLLQRLNDLEIEPLDGRPRPLSAEERSTVLTKLRADGDQTFAGLRKELKLPRGTRFNLERGGEEKLPGNRTESKLRRIFGDRWTTISPTDREQVIEDLLSFESESALQKRAQGHWKLDTDAAAELASLTLEDGYSRHSREALTLLVASMEQGTPYATARKELFPHSMGKSEPVSKLPPVKHVVRDLRNPAVERALTELRKVVNAIIGRYGVPDTIRLELARDLRNPRKRREELSKRMRTRQREREAAASRITAETNVSNPRRSDIERVMLADECQWRCPYTGRSISMESLFGANPQFDIEHIVPLSRSLDDSLANKTLCYHEENRARKRNRTPHQAYSADPQRWHEIVERVRSFSGPYAPLKLQRFLMEDTQFEEVYPGFVERQLNDTRYASRLAADYVGALYGGRADADGRQRVFVSAGGVTAFLRNEWQLNSILGLQGEKNRDDHRHHAIDALIIALATPKTVKMLSDAAERADSARRRFFAPIPPPWPSFLDDVRAKVDGIVVSRRVNHRARGLLHAESLYSPAMPGPDGQEARHIRKELHKLSRSEIDKEAIVDPRIRALVRAALEKSGVADPAKAFADPANHPKLPTRDGREIPIHKVRLRAKAKPWTIGKGARERHVAAKAGTNHHVELVAGRGKTGEEVWQDHCISLFEAYERRRRGEPIIRREWDDGQRFLFSLFPNDCVEMLDDDNQRRVFRVANVSDGDIEFRLHSDARLASDVKKERIRATSARFWKLRAVRKVSVTHLGDVIPAND